MHLKSTVQCFVLLSIFTGCTDKEPIRTHSLQSARSNIVASLPGGWSVISPSWQQERLTTAYFAHPHAEAFLLLGPQSNYISWTDAQDRSHREHIAKECLYIWLVPGDFKPPFPKFPSEPWGGGRLYSSKGINVYGYKSHHIADTNRMNVIMKNATRVSSPDIRISWTSWQQDIKSSLKD